MQKLDSVSPLHIVLLIMTASGLKNHVFAISPLISTTGRDAWISVLFTMVLCLLWIPLIIYIHRKSQSRHLVSLISETIGKRATNIVLLFFISYLVLMAGVSLRETITWTNVAYLPETPPFLLTIVFILVCLFLASSTFRAFNTVNIFLLFFISFLGFFVAITNFKYKNYSLLLPILANGYEPVFKGMIYQASGMVELLFFLLLQHKVNAPLRFRHFFITAIILTTLTFGPLTGAIIEFGPTEATRQRYPPFEEWGLVSIGSYIEHVDFLSIYQWLSGVFIRVSLLFLIIKEVLPIGGHRIKKWIMFFSSIAVAVIALVPITDFQFNDLLRNLILPATFWVFFFLSIFFGIVITANSWKKRRRV